MGKTTEARREKMKAKGLARELAKMADEDFRLNFEAAYTPPEGCIPSHHLLTKEEVEEIMNPAAALEKRLEKERVEKEKKRLKQQSQWERRQRANASTASASHEAPAPPAEEVPILDKRTSSSQKTPVLDKRKLQEKISNLQQSVEEEKRTAPLGLAAYSLGSSSSQAAPAKVFGASQAQEKKEASLDKREESSEADFGRSSSSASSSAASTASPSPLPKRPKPEPKAEVLDKRSQGVVLKENPQSLDKRGQVVLREVLDKRIPKNPQPVYKGKIAVDWHGVVEVNEAVPHEHIQALNSLKLAGYEVVLLSYGGRERNANTLSFAKKAWHGWSEILFTGKKTGRKGKAALCHQKGIDTIVDDSRDICYESWEWGLEVLGVCHFSQVHKWGDLNTYPSLPVAVKALLDKESTA